MEFIKRIKIYTFIATSLGVLTFIVCSLYTVYLINYIEVKLIISIVALIGAIQALFANLIYKKIQEYFSEEKKTVINIMTINLQDAILES